MFESGRTHFLHPPSSGRWKTHSRLGQRRTQGSLSPQLPTRGLYFQKAGPSLSHLDPSYLLWNYILCKCSQEMGAPFFPKPHWWDRSSTLGSVPPRILWPWLPLSDCVRWCFHIWRGKPRRPESTPTLTPIPPLDAECPLWGCHSERSGPLPSPSAPDPRLRDFAKGENQAIKQISRKLFPEE